jgi:hypothetical protein
VAKYPKLFSFLFHLQKNTENHCLAFGIESHFR